MKYFFFLLIIVVCALAYIRYQQPKMWNQYVEALKVTEPSDSSAPTQATTNQATTVTPPKPAAPEIISDSVLMNPDHTRPVDQPAGNVAPTNAPSTNSAPAPAAPPQ